jgi:L-serine kinase (ADP)
MYCIKTKKFTLELEIVPVAALLQHEQILTKKANKLTYEFKNLANLQNPVIVDENHVVLDGNHRTHVFKLLNFKYIPVCKIDYLNDSTKLRCWFRLLGNIPNIATIKRAFESSGCSIHPVSGKSALMAALETNTDACGIQGTDGFLFIEFPKCLAQEAVAAYDLLQQIQQQLLSLEISLDYIPCNAVHKEKFRQKLTTSEAVIWTPRLTKNTVIASAKEKKIFAPKATRHVIPARPLNVNVPGYWLKENISQKEINQRFENFLKEKQVRRFGPGQVIDGRYYEEELFVFFSSRRKGYQ